MVYRAYWLAVYVAANVGAAIIFGVTGELTGLEPPLPLADYGVLILATFAVVLSYLIWMGPVFHVMAASKIQPLFASWDWRSVGNIVRDERFVGYFLLTIQIGYLIFNVVEGVNTAGNLRRSTSPLSFIWSLFPPDYLFLAYYGIYRRSPFFAPNLCVYLISNIHRGWAGVWIILIFMEVAKLVRERRFNWKYVLSALAVVLLLSPVLIELKWIMRTAGVFDISVGEMTQLRVDRYAGLPWWEVYTQTLTGLVMRLQQVALVVPIIEKSEFLWTRLQSGEFLYFFEDGFPQAALFRLLEIRQVPPASYMLTLHLSPLSGIELGGDLGTYLHTGLVGWFWIAPPLWVIYVLYVTLLSWIGIWLAKKVGGGPAVMDGLWLAWLLFLMSGWFTPYLFFVQALITLIALRAIAGALARDQPALARKTF